MYVYLYGLLFDVAYCVLSLKKFNRTGHFDLYRFLTVAAHLHHMYSTWATQAESVGGVQLQQAQCDDVEANPTDICLLYLSEYLLKV